MLNYRSRRYVPLYFLLVNSCCLRLHPFNDTNLYILVHNRKTFYFFLIENDQWFFVFDFFIQQYFTLCTENSYLVLAYIIEISSLQIQYIRLCIDSQPVLFQLLEIVFLLVHVIGSNGCALGSKCWEETALR